MLLEADVLISNLYSGREYHAVYTVLSVTAAEVLATTLVPIIGLIRPKNIPQLTVSLVLFLVRLVYCHSSFIVKER